MRIRAALVAAALAVPAAAGVAAAATPVISDHASQQGCFGQARAATLADLKDQGYTPGRDFFSERKGDNAAMNAAYRADCQAQ